MVFLPAAYASESGGAAWQQWRAGNQVLDRSSLQRGARNFMNYCAGCHSLKYKRYRRIARDLRIDEDVFTANLLPADRRLTDYVISPMPAADGEAWFGKAPPDLSLTARAKGTDYMFQFLKTFYVDAARPTGVDNLALVGTAMPHVLADLQGLQTAVFGDPATRQGFEKFETAVPGRLAPAEYDAFVRDIVNFLDYVGEPAQLSRASIGIWVVLFLLAFTGIAWLLKQEYWKDIH